MSNEIAFFSKKNNTTEYSKPNEDFFICDEKRGIFIVADGVTRDLEDGKYPDPSPAAGASRIFSNTVYDILLEELKSMSFRRAALEAMIRSNEAVKTFNVPLDRGKNDFEASAVAVVAHLSGALLSMYYNGDCGCIIIRNGILHQVTQSQTKALIENRNGLTRWEVRKVIANNKSHPHGYGVFNGDERARDFITYTEMPLERNDVILLYSDGCELVLENLSPDRIAGASPEELVTLSEELEASMHVRSDDKTIIRIDVKEI